MPAPRWWLGDIRGFQNTFPRHILGEIPDVVICWIQNQVYGPAGLNHRAVTHDRHAVCDAESFEEIVGALTKFPVGLVCVVDEKDGILGVITRVGGMGL